MSNVKIYKASAGTGKTFSLVKEYLKIALKSPGEFGKILCITFTNKAAEEMKSRILEDLQNISTASPKGNAIKNAILSETKIPNIEEQASVLLNRILHNYSYFSVSTIDKFFITILKSFARELNLKLGFGIQLDINEVLDEIIPDTLKELRESDFATDMLVEYTGTKVDEGLSWDFKSKLSETSKLIFRDEYHADANDIPESKAREFYDHLLKVKQDFEDKISTLAAEAHDEILNKGLTIDNFKGGKTTSLFKYLNDLRTPGHTAPVEKIRQYSDSVDSWVTQKIDPSQLMIELFTGIVGQNLDKIIHHYDAYIEEYNTASLLLRNFNLFVILNKVTGTLKQYRDTNNTVLISDIYRIIQPLLETNDTPFIFEKVGVRYKYFLIDEAQDTSWLHWNNLMPLLKNAVAEGGTVVIVGDVKQSIYKFRNAYPEQFINIEKEFTEVTNISLKESRRSLKQITDFNNDLFEAVKNNVERISNESGELTQEDIRIMLDAYTDHEFENIPGNENGYVKLSFFKEPKRNDPDSPSAKEQTLTELVKDINRVKEAGYSNKDILILVEKHNQGAEINSFLKENGFDVVSSKSLLLTTSDDVRYLIALMRYINNNQDQVSLTEVLNYICNKSGLNLFELLETKKLYDIAGEKLGSGILKSYNYLAGLTVYELAENLLRNSGFEIKLDSYMIKFLDTVFRYSVDRENDLESFIEWWDANNHHISISGNTGTDTIEILTIHSAKGLERDVVFIPFADWSLKFKANNDKVWLETQEMPYSEFGKFPIEPVAQHRDSFFYDSLKKEEASILLDRTNLAYVAFTRAKHALFLYSKISENAFEKDSDRLKILSSFSTATDLLKTLVTTNEKYTLNSNLTYETGELKMYKSPTKDFSDDEKFMLDTEITSDWQKRLRIKTYYEDSDDFEKDRRLRGNLIHEILSMINTKDDLEGALTQLQDSGQLTAEQVKTFSEEIADIFSIEGIDKIFPENAVAFKEKEIITASGEMLRPDRVLEVDGKIKVIDFKTGKEHDSYKDQINEYAKLLSEIYDTKEIEKIILYTSLKKIEVVQ